MCNLYTQTRAADAIRSLFAAAQMPLAFPEGVPNLEPRDIAITDPGVIVRARGSASDDAPRHELVVRRWSWPGPGGRPIYNFRSEGREFSSGRCLILADGFYEFTAPADPRHKRKDRWLFTDPAGGLIGIAGLVRRQADIGEAFTMLTTDAGPDVVPYHRRQIVLLPPGEWRAWLDHAAVASDLIRTAPAGSLRVEKSDRA